MMMTVFFWSIGGSITSDIRVENIGSAWSERMVVVK